MDEQKNERKDERDTSVRLIHALLNPGVYDHPVTENPIKVIETHLSWVLLTGPFAYKIKKPVNFGFVDYSSIEKRVFYCQEEIRLNRPFSQDNIYLEVIKITGNPENPVLSPLMSPSLTPLEYAVKMKQFEESNLLTIRLNHNTVSEESILRFAEQLANFHLQAEKVRKDIPYGTPEKTWEDALENFLYFSSCITDFHVLNQIQQLKEWSKKEFNKHQALFEYRKSRGYIRNCHGDVHLNNMVFLNDHITLFDRIEFNVELRSIDVMNEVAFLLMDLEAKHKEDFGFLFLNRYLEVTGDYAGVKLLPFYKLYRALVRAKVALLSGKTIQDQEFISFINLAKTYILPKNPSLMILHGVSGSGKSFESAKLVSANHCIRIRSDVERKRIFKEKASKEKTSQEKKNPLNIYSNENILKVYKKLKDVAEDLLKAGVKVVVDATFLHKKHRDMFKKLAENCQVPFKIFHFEVDMNTLKVRMQRREREIEKISSLNEKEPSEANKMEIIEKQLETQDPLTEEELLYTENFLQESPK